MHCHIVVSDSVDKIVDDYMNQLLPAQSPYQISPTLRLDMCNNGH